MNDVIVVYDERREGYILIRGRETFYDENRYLRVWDTETEAIEWATETLGVTPSPPETS